MLNKVKLQISNYILRRRILQLKRFPKLTPLSQTKKIALLFDAQSNQSIKELKFFIKYFLKLNIDVDALGFVNSRKKEAIHISTLHVNYFNLNDLSFFGVPKSSKINSFLLKNYDVLINLSTENSFPTKYLALISKSSCRIGVDTLDNYVNYDLIFRLKIKSLGYFIENLIHYLELIDQNHNEK